MQQQLRHEEEVARFPKRIVHDFHPHHPLLFNDAKNSYDRKRYWCASCHRHFQNGYFYSYNTCSFFMDSKCAPMQPINREEGRADPTFNILVINIRCRLSSPSSTICWRGLLRVHVGRQHTLVLWRTLARNAGTFFTSDAPSARHTLPIQATLSALELTMRTWSDATVVKERPRLADELRNVHLWLLPHKL
ncbi:hypothetical protein TorRG33x02_115240 [Trema orientale]|uniref:DC1 domain-containing protein n=1 Tax=Trema orientale TaxID=63057 RepID=A0A2P5F4F4_TREOI|nr:hypothetical protein TorRG33x02_115240 [Trema orientale]